MKIKIDYYSKRKSDGKMLNIYHVEIDENEILELAKEKTKQPYQTDVELYDYIIDEVII